MVKNIIRWRKERQKPSEREIKKTLEIIQKKANKTDAFPMELSACTIDFLTEHVEDVVVYKYPNKADPKSRKIPCIIGKDAKAVDAAFQAEYYSH